MVLAILATFHDEIELMQRVQEVIILRLQSNIAAIDRALRFIASLIDQFDDNIGDFISFFVSEAFLVMIDGNSFPTFLPEDPKLTRGILVYLRQDVFDRCLEIFRQFVDLNPGEWLPVFSLSFSRFTDEDVFAFMTAALQIREPSLLDNVVRHYSGLLVM
jgi:hypothetical protein